MSGGPYNEDLFDEAVARLRETECYWEQQLEYALGHPADLALDFDALGGRYELVRPFVHRAVAGALGALSKVGFDPATRTMLGDAVHCVIITASAPGQGYGVGLGDRLMLLQAPLAEGPEDPVAEFEAAIRRALAPADRYARIALEMARLERVLRDAGLWPGEPPPRPIEVKGAFGCENMAFTQWLAWVLIPRLCEIIEQRGTFPASSQLATYAIRELSSLGGENEVYEVLDAIDKLVNSPG